jgi:hypothetical protein
MVLVWCVACQQQKVKKRSDILFEKGKGIFRSVDFDMTMEAVMQREKAPLVNSAEDYLRYEIQHINNTREFIQIEYMFSRQRLDRIMVYYHVERKEDADQLFNEARAYFEKKFGKSTDIESGWLIWELDDRGGLPGTIEIMISNESRRDMYGLDIEMVKYYKDEEKTTSFILRP